MAVIDKLTLLYIRERKLLFCRSRGRAKWYLPGGKREKSEKDNEAIIREVKEELDVDLLPETLKYHGVFKAQAYGKKRGTRLNMICYWGEYQGEIKPSSEVVEIAWFTTDDRRRTTHGGRLILVDLKNQGLID